MTWQVSRLLDNIFPWMMEGVYEEEEEEEDKNGGF